MKKISVLFVAVLIAFMSGCVSKEDTSRYASIEIPEYFNNDYRLLLSDKNPEVVYNAVCNLAENASSMAGTLSDKKADKKSRDYIIAQNVRDKILELLQSRNEKIVAASLRFLQLFAGSYAKKSDLIEPVLKVRPLNTNVQYEKLETLTRIVSKDSKVDSRFLKKSLKNRSWLASRATYLLINNLENEDLRAELINKYRTESEEMEKLLILTALEKNFSGNVFAFLTTEVLSTKSYKIKTVIFKMFTSAAEKDKVLDWVAKNYGKLSKNDAIILADTCYGNLSDNFSSALAITLIKNGFKPDDKFLKKLLEGITGYEGEKSLSDEKKASLKNLLNIERELLLSNSMKDIWVSLRQMAAKERFVDKEMLAEYNKTVDQFILNTDEIFKKYKVEEEKRKKYMEDLSGLKGNL